MTTSRWWHGGDLDGFVLVKGDKEVLARLQVSGEFVRMIVRVQPRTVR